MTGDPAIVILAGGEGRRIGGGKPLLMLAGERLIDRALELAHGWSGITAVSVRDPAQVRPVEAQLIIDERSIVGPLAGLVSALRFGVQSGSEFVLTIAADMPFLPRDLPGRLLVQIGDRGCAVASSGGHLHPVCGLWRTLVLGQVETYLKGEKRSLHGFASLVGFGVAEWPAEPIDPFFNINSGEELAAAALRCT